ncbi:hypothetical protein E2986_05793 [Frieseomelitta varia]|uniref:Pre-rRNA-processing protein TSR2 homolog n=1 Tax=Frieseomelitta varia TaxID=561572 RepID=A0A833S2N2_9HYME|nr:uncharacterized protein LOC122528165 [Frieseomelitta varia]KAF3427831.1 hypothetical protein E2986_05793 [Frieseomelitta varia]
MSNTKEFFLSVVQRIFSNWTALRMVVEHNMGTKKMVIDFCSYMTEVMYMNEGLNVSEIANELEKYIDEQFNTELEDNSSEQVAEELLRFYRYCIESHESLAVTEFAKLSPLQKWLDMNKPAKEIQTVCAMETDSSESEKETSDDMKVVDEWTEVTRKRRR